MSGPSSSVLVPRTRVRWVLRFLLMVVSVETSGGAVICRRTMDIERLSKIGSLSKLMKTEAEDLYRFYIDGQGESPEYLCQMRFEKIPDPVIVAPGPWDRLLSVYTKLRLFQWHLNVVRRQQEDLQTLPSKLLISLSKAWSRADSLALKVRDLLHALQKNQSVPDPPVSPTPSPMDAFQQKGYGCAVVTRYRDFLSHVVQELKKCVATNWRG